MSECVNVCVCVCVILYNHEIFNCDVTIEFLKIPCLIHVYLHLLFFLLLFMTMTVEEHGIIS